MNVNMEREVRKIFSKARANTPQNTKKRPTIKFTLLAILATLILVFQTIAIAPPKAEIKPNPILYYKVNDPGQLLQPVTFYPIDAEIHFVGCAHIRPNQPVTPNQKAI